MLPCHPEAHSNDVTAFGSDYRRYRCAECRKVWEHRTEPVNPDDEETPVSYDPEWAEPQGKP